MSSPSPSPDRARKVALNPLLRAAIEGLIAGAALLGCAPAESKVVTAPMEVSTPHAGSTSRQATSTGSGRTLEPSAPVAKDCCRGRNECKGKSGCSVGKNGCQGKNDCKGTGTACEPTDDDDDPASPRQPTVTFGSTANCCAGKNMCKGQSACRTAKNTAGPGANQCKGLGTNCPPRGP